MVYASLVLVHYQGADFFNGLTFIKVIGNVAVITTANRYLPLPGGEGTMQLQMHILLSYENKTTDSGVDNAIFTWRFFTAYLPAIYGIGGFCFYLSSFAKSVKNKKPIFKK
jgi:uncharacterized membrane protein YbhN (UPF0104 family)